MKGTPIQVRIVTAILFTIQFIAAIVASIWLSNIFVTWLGVPESLLWLSRLIRAVVICVLSYFISYVLAYSFLLFMDTELGDSTIDKVFDWIT